MKKIFSGGLFPALLQIAIPCLLHAQLITLPNGGNKKASVSEWVGITNVSIQYDRPGVKGREGQIWGKLVPVGFADLGFGNTKQAPCVLALTKTQQWNFQLMSR